MILVVVVSLLVLSYFGFNLRELSNKPETQDNFSFVASTTVTFWNSYLKDPASYLWNDVFMDLIWEPAIDNLTKMKNGEPTVFEEAAAKRQLPPAIPSR